MDTFFAFFVGQPMLLLVIAALFFIACIFARSNPDLRAKALLTPAVLWLLWAVWEWSITRFSPEADIRVDLLIIILPVVFIVTVVAVIMLFRKPNAGTGKDS